jgi:hypothetical protein
MAKMIEGNLPLYKFNIAKATFSLAHWRAAPCPSIRSCSVSTDHGKIALGHGSSSAENIVLAHFAL